MSTNGTEFEIRTLTTADEMVDVVDVFQQVWGSPTELVRLEMLMAVAHSGGYVCAAYDPTRPGYQHGQEHGQQHGTILGASLGILARHHDQPALHSHVTGLLPGVRHSGVGRALKMHQRCWAAERDIDWIVWTYDPLVRRNAWFNIAVLGADVHEYLPSFYGTMTDALNTGDESDRLLVAWDVHQELPSAPRDGSGLSGTELIPTPEDIVALRRTSPTEVAQWRSSTRDALSSALAADRPVVGFTREGEYVIGASA